MSKFPIIPASVQPAMRDAQLPLRVEAARRALAECVDLSELLNWKDKAAAIAAAAKAAKLPDIARDARRLQKEALLRLGQLLSEYGGGSDQTGRVGSAPGRSERRLAADAAGVPVRYIAQVVRFAKAPAKQREAILSNDKIPPHPIRMVTNLPRVSKRGQGLRRSDMYDLIVNGNPRTGGARFNGLNAVANSMHKIAALSIVGLALDEKKIVRAKITEIAELLDAIDEACK